MIKLFLVCLSIIAINFAVGQEPIGSNPCTWGPSFWCSNLSNAQRCDTVNWCAENVWGNAPSIEDQDQMNCNICGTLVKKSREQLKRCSCQESLKKVFAKYCNKLQIKNVKSKCRSVLENFPALLQMLESDMSPQAICKVAGLCGTIKTSCENSNNANSDRYGRNKCTWGPSYWCLSESTARGCGSGALAYCRKNVWNGNKPEEPKGKNKCTRGPAYWCQNEHTAIECEALKYCRAHVWMAK